MLSNQSVCVGVEFSTGLVCCWRAGLVSSFQVRDWEDQMLTLGVIIQPWFLILGPGCFFSLYTCVKYQMMCYVYWMPVYENVFLCRRVLRYGRVRASQVRWAVGSSAEVLENKAKRSRRPRVQGLQPDLCINTGSFVHTCQR